MGLGMEKRAVALLVMVVFGSLHLSIAAVYEVGDSKGWTTIGNVDYKKWASTKTFLVGDIILFVYNPQFHNVMQVTHTQYQSCDTSAPLTTHNTGNDSFPITTLGHHYFLCGIPGHCKSGQKVDINVLSVSMAPTPSPSPSPSGPFPMVPPPSSEAAPLHALSSFLGKLGLAMAVIASFV